ncbi:mif domain containing [Trichoderma arundinaceum]|uniref:L-dopachrome isomerase n=1 Tax=Trichoderma arundinaceum TaxID=490622 RepID=A0A395NIH9_TRIAR|nr:mif domain containing [Trichoderma arundinaceum]
MDQPPLSPQARNTPILHVVEPSPNAAATPQTPTPERKSKSKSRISSLESVLESDSRAPLTASSEDASNTAATLVSLTSRYGKERLSENRSQYFHHVLHERSKRSLVAETVLREALIYAEVITNVKIENEHHFLTNFSPYLATRYNRSPDSTVISLHHSQCLFFGGSSYPAYILTITALPSEVQPATNKRNAAVLQKYMEALIRVPSARGIVRFVPVAEECLAWGGKTVAGRISDAVAGDRDAVREGDASKAHERRMLKSLSLRRASPANITPPNTQPPTPSKHAQGSTANATVLLEPNAMFGEEESSKVVRKKKSIIQTLFRTSRAEEEDPSRS